jgi:transposase
MADGRNIPHHELETMRFAALKLRSNGVSPAIIADSLGVTVGAVYNWSHLAKKHGERALISTKAPGAPSALTQEQLEEILSCLRKPASEWGYDTDLWSGPRLRHLIRTRFGIKYNAKYMPEFLRRLGLRMIFPERRALEQDPEAVKNWKNVDLPRSEEEARKRRALLFYADETSISLVPSVGRTWAFPGVRPVVRVSGSRRKNVNVTGAVNRSGHLYFEMLPQGERFTSKSFIRFLEKLRGHFPKRNLSVIVDGASVHRSKVVKEFCAEHKWIRLEYLPPYSPEWNPSEEVWGHLKGCCRNGSQSKDVPSLRRETRSILKRMQKKPKKVKTFFGKLEKLKK